MRQVFIRTISVTPARLQRSRSLSCAEKQFKKNQLPIGLASGWDSPCFFLVYLHNSQGGDPTTKRSFGDDLIWFASERCFFRQKQNA